MCSLKSINSEFAVCVVDTVGFGEVNSFVVSMNTVGLSVGSEQETEIKAWDKYFHSQLGEIRAVELQKSKHWQFPPTLQSITACYDKQSEIKNKESTEQHTLQLFGTMHSNSHSMF